jgi:hypothetical protein
VIVLVSVTITVFTLPAIAADDLPRNVELKPSAAPAAEAAGRTAQDTGPGTTTRQIITEGKNSPPTEAPKDSTPAAAPGASVPAQAPAALDKPENAPPAASAEEPKPPAKAASPEVPPPATPGLNPEEVVVAVQTELKRVGCDPGAIDGAWGGRSREALAAFGHFAKLDVGKLAPAPTPEILELIKGKVDVVCVNPAPPERQMVPPAHHDRNGGGPYGGGGGY